MLWKIIKDYLGQGCSIRSAMCQHRSRSDRRCRFRFARFCADRSCERLGADIAAMLFDAVRHKTCLRDWSSRQDSLRRRSLEQDRAGHDCGGCAQREHRAEYDGAYGKSVGDALEPAAPAGRLMRGGKSLREPRVKTRRRACGWGGRAACR